MKPAVATYQAQWELHHLLDMIGGYVCPSRVLEVGCYEGGTLWHWLRIADTVVAVDDACRNADHWREWADELGSKLHVIQGDSRHPDTLAQANEHGPYDFAFIDADHTYEAVRDDFLNYSPMIADGGCIAFHDILPRPNYGVSTVWSEVKTLDGVRWIEICQNETEAGNEGPCGIGVAWLP